MYCVPDKNMGEGTGPARWSSLPPRAADSADELAEVAGAQSGSGAARRGGGAASWAVTTTAREAVQAVCL
ncbi:Protein of unknown function, partial [Gryllus bimaculatus]